MIKGLNITKPKKISLQEIVVNERLHEDEVKIKVIYGGICGSDVAVYQGLLPHAIYPLIPGHEILGEVVAVGKNTKLNIGTRVILQPNTYCSTCETCKLGKTNICPNKKSFGININGGFAEEIIVPSKYLIPVPEGLTNERAILVEPLAVVVHAFSKVQLMKANKVAIIGCGTEGMLAISLATYLGLAVTAIDIRHEKLSTIKAAYPNVQVLHPSELIENTYDIVFEAAGTKQSFEQSVQITKPGGHIVVIGFTKLAEIRVIDVVRKEITIKGSIIYRAPQDFLTSFDYLLDERFHVMPIISQILPVSQYEQAYEMATSGKYRKIILQF